MTKWVRRIFVLVSATFLERFKKASSDFIRIEAAKYYLKGIQVARHSLMGLVALVSGIFILNLGLTMLVSGIFLILPLSLQMKAILLMILGAITIGLPTLALLAFFKERTWMDFFKAEEVVQRITHQGPASLKNVKADEDAEINWEERKVANL